MNKKIKLILQLGITFGLFYILLKNVNINSIEFKLSILSFILFSLALILKLIAIFWNTQILKCAIKISEKNIKLETKRIYTIYFISYFFSVSGLGSLGSDSYKFISLKNIGFKSKKVFNFLIYEKIIGLVVLCSFLLISIIYYFYLKKFYLYTFVPILILIVTFCLLLIINRVQMIIPSKLKISKFLIHVRSDINSNKITFIYSLFYSLFFYLCIIFSFYFLTKIINPELPLLLSFFIIPSVLLLSSIPISYQGFGIREVSIVYFFELLGYNAQQGLYVSILLLIQNLIIVFFGGVLYLINSLLEHNK